MQRIATRLFIGSSIVFGVTGLLVVLTTPALGGDGAGSALHMVLLRFLPATVFVILPSFALSVAGKFLNGNS